MSINYECFDQNEDEVQSQEVTIVSKKHLVAPSRLARQSDCGVELGQLLFCRPCASCVY